LSTQQLCQYLAAAEEKIRRQKTLIKHSILPGIKKRKRSETPSEKLAYNDEAKYAEQEIRGAKRVEHDDHDYEHKSMKNSSSD
jgi:hypothetical protein